jgi:hypothetical protein
VEQDELKQMADFVKNLPAPTTNFKCAAFNPVPSDQNVLRLMPATRERLESMMFGWKHNLTFAAPGLCESAHCKDHEEMKIHGAQLVSVEPSTMQRAMAEKIPGVDLLPSFVHRSGDGWDLRMSLVQSLCFLFDGSASFRGWHQDEGLQLGNKGGRSKQGRFHKLYVMVEKSTAQSERLHSNLAVLPRNAPKFNLAQELGAAVAGLGLGAVGRFLAQLLVAVRAVPGLKQLVQKVAAKHYTHQVQ